MSRPSVSVTSASFIAATILFALLRSTPAQIQPKPVEETKEGISKEAPDKKALVIEVSNQQVANEVELRKSLGTPVEANFTDAPLNTVIQSIAKSIGQNIWMDQRALAEEGVQPNVAVTHQGKPISAGRLLDRILPPLGLTWFVQDHVVQVTTIIAAEDVLVTRTYPVGDLIEYGKTHRSQAVAIRNAPELQFVQFGGCGNDANICDPPPDQSPEGWLLELLQRMTLGLRWDHLEGPQGTLSYLNHTIVIRQTHQVHDRCAMILQTVRQFTKGGLPNGTVEIRPLHYSTQEDAAVKKALQKVISIHSKDVPLQKLLEALSDRLAVPIDVDQKALNEEGVSVEEPISMELKQIPAASALKLVLEPIGCCALVEDGRILVTTRMTSEEHLFAKFYDVRDLHEAGYGGSKLLDVLQETTPGAWLKTANFGHAPMVPLDGLLAVRQTQRVHDEIEGLFTDLRKQIVDNPSTRTSKSQPVPQK